jgi:hypothetical protein
VEQFLHRLGAVYRGSGKLFLVGGSLMVYGGFRAETIDIAYVVQLPSDDDTAFVSAVRGLIRELNLNVEQAGPSDFLPLPRGWEDRSRFVGRYGDLEVFAFDPISTVLAKIERVTRRDIDDALALLQAGQVTLLQLTASFEEIVPRLEREYLRVDPDDFYLKFAAFLELATIHQTSLGPQT